MFDDTLLDSSPSQTPALNMIHYGISLVLGVAAFFGARSLWGQLTGAEESTIAFAAGVVGGIIFAYALMVCYIYADSRQLGLSTGIWVAIGVVLNVLGYLFYAYFSAKKSGDWKRFTIPVAYICEVIMVGVMVLIPLIYTEALPTAAAWGTSGSSLMTAMVLGITVGARMMSSAVTRRTTRTGAAAGGGGGGGGGGGATSKVINCALGSASV